MYEIPLPLDMLTSTIDKRTFRAIVKGKLPIIIPPLFVGTFGGLYYATKDISLDNKLIYGIVVPVALIIGFGAAMLGATIAAKKMIGNTFELTDAELTLNKSGTTEKIKIEDIKSTQENVFGLRIKSESNTISIPKHLDNYNEFAEKLKNLA